MNRVKTPRILKTVFPEITWDFQDTEPSLYLTFDDGPTPAITTEVLSILARFNAKATFFCIGRNVERNPDVYQQLLTNGHATGNHTYSHLKGWYTPNREYYNDINLAAQFIQSGLYRPAYGMITPMQLRQLGQQYRIVMWNIMSYDFDYSTSPEKCLKNVIRYTSSGSIVVFHDSVKASKKLLFALPRVLEYYADKGFTFKSIL
jgi:peptidoglycan/xylan/chitin deacetylase (PgdA/CDA1 family)